MCACPVLLHGDAAEDAAAYAQLRRDLVQHDDPRGPWETLLLDRVVSLAWRLQRIPKVERGLLTKATLGLSWARASRRLREAHAPDLGRLGVDGAALATNPHRLAQSVQSVRTLRAAIAEGAPDPALARRVLIEVFGNDLHGTPLGAGSTLLEALQSPHDPAEPFARLDELLALLGALQETAELEAAYGDQAAVETRLLPGENAAQALQRYERHLQREMVGAVRELERAQAKRRMEEALRGIWGRGG